MPTIRSNPTAKPVVCESPSAAGIATPGGRMSIGAADAMCSETGNPMPGLRAGAGPVRRGPREVRVALWRLGGGVRVVVVADDGSFCLTCRRPRPARALRGARRGLCGGGDLRAMSLGVPRVASMAISFARPLFRLVTTRMYIYRWLAGYLILRVGFGFAAGSQLVRNRFGAELDPGATKSD